jgi:hypothetical protein
MHIIRIFTVVPIFLQNVSRFVGQMNELLNRYGMNKVSLGITLFFILIYLN